MTFLYCRHGEQFCVNTDDGPMKMCHYCCAPYLVGAHAEHRREPIHLDELSRAADARRRRAEFANEQKRRG